MSLDEIDEIREEWVEVQDPEQDEMMLDETMRFHLFALGWKIHIWRVVHYHDSHGILHEE